MRRDAGSPGRHTNWCLEATLRMTSRDVSYELAAEGTDPYDAPARRRDAGRPASAYFFLSGGPEVERAAMNASWGTSTRPTIFIRFLPSFCFSSSLRLRVMSPP